MTAKDSMPPIRVDICGGAREGKSALVARLAANGAGGQGAFIASEAATDEQYTRTLRDGAPIADVSVIVVDARQGVTPATRRQGFFAGLLAVRHVVLAVNKMDLVDNAQAAFARIENDFRELAAQLGLGSVACLPISAESGDNVDVRSAAMPWYAGPTLAELLARVEPAIEGARAGAEPRLEIADQFEATVVWLSDAPLLRGRSYTLKLGGQLATATINPVKYKFNLSTLDRIAAVTLIQKEIGVCNLQLDRDLPFAPYKANREAGRFLVLDRVSGATVGAGMLHFALRRAQNIHWQALDVNKVARAALKGQRPCVLWYTGLSGAGKSTIANLVDKRLHAARRHTYLLDGDNVRHGLNRDLGFTDADRVENIRRIAEVAKLMVDAGLIVSTAFISPFRAERQMARALVPDGEFIEIFVDTPLGVAEQRDPKGLYKKARRGDLKNFTGIDSPYERPENPELTIDTTAASPEQAAERVVAYLEQRGIVGAPEAVGGSGA
jgi:bifunctional enzyme CysN/CysC